jgi:excisionase family DNA binding protein
MSKTPTSLCNPTEAAKILGVSRATMGRMLQDGRMPYVQKMPGQTGAYVLSRAEVNEMAKLKRKAA